MHTKIHLLIFILIFLLSCNQHKKNQDSIDIIASAKERPVAVYKKLDGKWSGVYESTIYEPDTVFYKNYKENLDYLLTGEVKDSSLVKEIKKRVIPTSDSMTMHVQVSKKYLDEPSEDQPKRANIKFFTDYGNRAFDFSTTMSLLEYEKGNISLKLESTHNESDNTKNSTDEVKSISFSNLNDDDTHLSVYLDDLINASEFDLQVLELSTDTLILSPKHYDGRFVLTKK